MFVATDIQNSPNNVQKTTHTIANHIYDKYAVRRGYFGTCGICPDCYCIRKLLIVNGITDVIASRLIAALLREFSSRSAFSTPTDVHRNHRKWGFFFHNLCHKKLFLSISAMQNQVFYAKNKPKTSQKTSQKTSPKKQECVSKPANLDFPLQEKTANLTFDTHSM